MSVDAGDDGVPDECKLPGLVLVIDEDSISNGNPPNFFSDVDVNEDIADIGLRTQLPVFANNVGDTITLHTGEVGDEGWFALKTIPDSWAGAGPTDDGLLNFFGLPSEPPPHSEKARVEWTLRVRADVAWGPNAKSELAVRVF